MDINPPSYQAAAISHIQKLAVLVQALTNFESYLRAKDETLTAQAREWARRGDFPSSTEIDTIIETKRDLTKIDQVANQMQNTILLCLTTIQTQIPDHLYLKLFEPLIQGIRTNTRTSETHSSRNGNSQESS